jgi:hypothetical protein
MPESHKPPEPRELLLDVLLDKVEQDRFPSIPMLDMIESLLRPDEVQIYVRVLLRKVEDDNYPSIPMLQRIAGLTG